MDPLMTPEERLAMVNKISEKVKDMTDEDMKELAKEIGIDEVVADADKDVSKALADAVMSPTTPVVNTDVLTGSRDGLKSFLMKKSRDKESQA